MYAEVCKPALRVTSRHGGEDGNIITILEGKLPADQPLVYKNKQDEKEQHVDPGEAETL